MQSGQNSGHYETRLPSLDLPRIPHALTMWSRALTIALALLVIFLFDRLTVTIMDSWLLEQQGYGEVFWTNFTAGFWLFALGFVAFFGAVATAAIGKNKMDYAWRRMLWLASIAAGLLGGYLLSRRYEDVLQLFGSLPTGEIEPVFGNDISFYMFELSTYWLGWLAVFGAICVSLLAQLIVIRVSGPSHQKHLTAQEGRITRFFVGLSTPVVLGLVGALGVLAAIGVWLSRYDILWKDNYKSAIYVGAQRIDGEGLLSYSNYYVVTGFLVLALTVGLIVILRRVHRAVVERGDYREVGFHARRLGYLVVLVVAADFGFAGLIAARDFATVTPNEPMVQLPYIKRHIDATLRGYGLDKIETVEFIPAGPSDPIPPADELLKSATLKNAPLWPGWVSYLERVVDPQHADRILRTSGDPMVYGPTIDVFRAQQKLRSYYDFLKIDSVRYTIGGEKKLLVSSVRELPFLDPKPWIAWWGQRNFLFTHSHGLVAAPAAEVGGEGEPRYLTYGIPMQSRVPELKLDNPSLYYSKGADQVMAFTNAREIKEFDVPTDEGRQETVLPPDVNAGIAIDSAFKRFIVGWRSGQPLNVWFTGLITSDTRLHYPRPPLDRLKVIAPFLFYDTNTFAVAHDGRIHWMINAISTSRLYPYSQFDYLGDKSDEQSLVPGEMRYVNYVRDAVKAVVDAYTGQVTLYKYADEPVINTWAHIYPSLFKPREAMPQGLRAHVQYPRQLKHMQFDDIYYKYHMTDPMTFFNLEDMWDDADEVKGPILTDGRAITFSIEPRNWIAETGGILPAAKEREQFVISKVYTNEQALNLRAITMVYQDGEDYGRMVVLRVPKGKFYPGTEQADAAIDQEPDISEQLSWWNRTGSDVIRGHTSTLVVGNEVIYVEPLFIRSRQNPVTQLKRVLVVFRGFAASGMSLEEALRAAMDKARKAQERTIAQAGD